MKVLGHSNSFNSHTNSSKYYYYHNFKIYLFLAALGLPGSLHCAGFLRLCKQGLPFILVHRLLTVVASPVTGHRLQVLGLQWCGEWA